MIIDCDANATYVPDEEIQRVVSAALGLSGNPSSLHRRGQRARAALEESRASLREFLGVGPKDEIVFTSGATEANNTVLASHAARFPKGRIVSTLIEHPCVLEPLKRLKASGYDVVLVPPKSDGSVSVERIVEGVSRLNTLVSIMAANNETGVINPVTEIVRAVKNISSDIMVHTDAAQLLGKSLVSWSDLRVDLMTISGHKFGAPSGVGAIVIRDGVTLEPMILGGPQEMKLRGGTENVSGIAALGAVASLLKGGLATRIGTMRGARDSFEALVQERIEGCSINCADQPRLPNTTSLCIPGVRADDLVVALDLEGILVSSGAACSSGKPEPSHVLLAMGQDEKRVKSTIRISFRSDIDQPSVTRVVDVLAQVVGRMNRSA